MKEVKSIRSDVLFWAILAKEELWWDVGSDVVYLDDVLKEIGVSCYLY